MEHTIYQAEIPTLHQSDHTSERAAVKALSRAEAQYGVEGQVRMIVTSGQYVSSTVVYPIAGPTRA